MSNFIVVFMFEFVIIFVGFVVGFIVGLIGVGGGLLMMLILIFFFGIKFYLVVGIDLLFVVVIKVGGMVSLVC